MSTTTKKDPFAGYVPHGPEWKAYLMKQPKALIVEVATGIADERDRLKEEKKELLEALHETSAALLQHLSGVGSKTDARARYEIARSAIAKVTHP
jgi:hypothetical protein